jgi:hypothetical protein
MMAAYTIDVQPPEARETSLSPLHVISSCRPAGGQNMRKLLFALLVLAASPAIAQDKEKLSATDISVRVALTFKMPDAVVQKLLPAGFEINSPTTGPVKGSNLAIGFIDYLMVQGPDGKPLPPVPTVAINVPSKKIASGESVGVIVGGFVAQPAAPGPYFVYGPAKITVNRQSHTDTDGKSIIDEAWQATADDGSALEIQLQFARGVPERRKIDLRTYSAAKPEFYRIYRTEQAVDVARSTATGIDRVTRFTITATGPKLAPLFNGSEQLISITSTPFYSRSIFLPAM